MAIQGRYPKSKVIWRYPAAAANTAVQLGKFAYDNRNSIARAARYGARQFQKYSTNNRVNRNSKRTAGTAGAANKRVKMPSKSTGPGRSGGFLTTQKIKPSVRQRMSKRGIVYTKETGGATSSPDSVTLGHISAPVGLLVANAWRALFKHLLLEAGADVKSTDDSLEMKINDQVIVFYGQTNGGFVLNETFTSAGAGTTIETLVTWATGNTLAWNVNAAAEQTQFQAIRFVPTNALGTVLTAVTVSMQQCKLHFVTKSALKMQNRTVDVTADNEADDVNNVPLFGTSYEGKGTGSVYIAKKTGSGAQECLFGHTTRGTILAELLNEPPEAQALDRVTRTGKVKIEPGEIKTSVLNSTIHMTWNDFWNDVYPIATDSSATLRKKMGVFRVFVIEKMIHFAAVDSAIQTVYECNIDIMTNLTFSRSFQSIRKFEAERGINL